jgi:hypothetical protein
VRPALAGAHVLAATLVATVLLGTLPGLPAQAATTTVGGTYYALQPARILDTRDGTGGVGAAPLQARGQLTVQVEGRGNVPATGVAAVVMNVTVTNTTAASYLTVFPAGVAMPLVSNLNWVGGQTVPNLVAVALGGGAQLGQVTVYNSAGSVDVIFDVAGYYSTPAQSPGPDGLFNPVVPARLLDTRSTSPLGPGGVQTVQVSGRGGVPGFGVAAVVLNVTVTGGTQPGYVTAWPSGATRPVVSNLNFVAGQTVANRAVVKPTATTSATGNADKFTYTGRSGALQAPPKSPAPRSPAAQSAPSSPGPGLARSPAAQSAPSSPGPGLKLTWAPPPCGDVTHGCARYDVANTGSHQFLSLSPSQDWIVKLPSVPVLGGLDIEGGHNVIIIGGEIDLTTPCVTDTNVCHGINLSRSSSSTGEVYIEGVLIKNPDPTHSQYTGDGIDVNTSATSNITIQNVRVEGIDGCDANGVSAHADVFQPYGAQGAVIHVDHLSGTTDFQGMEINPDTATPSSGVYENVNIDVLPNPHACAGWNGDLYVWWLTEGATSCTTYPMSLYNDYAAEPNGSLANHAVWPDTDTTFGCPAQYMNAVANWPQLPSISGGVRDGLPPGGDFVPAGVAGLNYVSPGYSAIA